MSLATVMDVGVDGFVRWGQASARYGTLGRRCQLLRCYEDVVMIAVSRAGWAVRVGLKERRWPILMARRDSRAAVLVFYISHSAPPHLQKMILGMILQFQNILVRK